MIHLPQLSERIGVVAIQWIPLLAGINLGLPAARGQGQEEQSVQASIAVLNEIMAVPAQAIPQRMSSRCRRRGHCAGGDQGRVRYRRTSRPWHFAGSP